MKKFTTCSGNVMPMPYKDVDTDMIIPAQFLASTSTSGYGENLFRRFRDDPTFPMNLPQYKGAPILVARDNFGCGSSREHAVWALTQAGFQVIIAPSFADIFFGNSAKNGLLLVKVSEAVAESFIERATNGSLSLTVDLVAQKVTVNGTSEEYAFPYDPFRKHCLLEGLDDLDYLLAEKQATDSFHTTRQHTYFTGAK